MRDLSGHFTLVKASMQSLSSLENVALSQQTLETVASSPLTHIYTQTQRLNGQCVFSLF